MTYDSEFTHSDAELPHLSVAQYDSVTYYNILLNEDGVAQGQWVADQAQRFIA
jgi:hypothetical protein